MRIIDPADYENQFDEAGEDIYYELAFGRRLAEEMTVKKIDPGRHAEDAVSDRIFGPRLPTGQKAIVPIDGPRDEQAGR